MKFTDNDIDKLFQDMDDKAPVEFKESYWKEMEQMLPQKKKRIFPFWLKSLMLIPISGFSALIYFGLQNNNSKNIASQSSMTNQKINSSIEYANHQKSVKTFPIDGYSTKETNISISKIEKQQTYNSLAHLESKKIFQNKYIPSKVQNSQVESQTLNSKILDSYLTHYFNYETSTQVVDSAQNSLSTDMENRVPNDFIINDIENRIVNNTEPVNQEDILLNSNQALNTEVENLINNKVIKPSTWKMYLGFGAGVLTNLGLDEKSYNAGIFKIEYGVDKSFGRFHIDMGIGIENSFGKSVLMHNLYTTYDGMRNEHTQEYAYNRFTNFVIPIGFGIHLGKLGRHNIELKALPQFNFYNNVIYQETKNGELTANEQYFDQDLGIRKLYISGGISYSYLIKSNLALSFEYFNNFGTNLDKHYEKIQQSKSNHQFLITLRYYLK